MKEQMWSVGQRTRMLFDLIDEMRWEDTAARDINARYLTPLGVDSREMQAAYRDQSTAIESAREQSNVAESHMRQAYEAGQQMHRFHGYLQQEIRQAEHEFEMARKQETTARLQLPRVQQLINSADEAGR